MDRNGAVKIRTLREWSATDNPRAACGSPDFQVRSARWYHEQNTLLFTDLLTTETRQLDFHNLMYDLGTRKIEKIKHTFTYLVAQSVGI
jgi:hypothetical protein